MNSELIRQIPANPDEILGIDPKEIWVERGGKFADHALGQTTGNGATIRNSVLFPRMEKLLGKIDQETTILDAGCGNSVFCDRLRDKTNSIYEFDIVASLLSASSKDGKKVFMGDMTQTLPLPEQSFDKVISNLNLMWLPEISHFASEAMRVLKPGGNLVMSITHPFVNLGEWEDHESDNPVLINRHPLNTGVFWKMINMTIGPYLYYQRPASEYINSFTQEGFKLTPGSGYEEVFFTNEEIDMLGPYYKKHQNFPLFLLLSFDK